MIILTIVTSNVQLPFCSGLIVSRQLFTPTANTNKGLSNQKLKFAQESFIENNLVFVILHMPSMWLVGENIAICLHE